MTQDEWAALVAKSQARFTAMTAEEQAAEREAQKLSFVRGQMGVEPVGVPTPHADVLRLTRELDATRAALAEAQGEVAHWVTVNNGLCDALDAADAALSTARDEGRREGLEAAMRACDWGDIYGDNAVAAIRALMEDRGNG